MQCYSLQQRGSVIRSCISPRWQVQSRHALTLQTAAHADTWHGQPSVSCSATAPASAAPASTSAASSASAASSPVDGPAPGTWFDQLSETQRYVLADEWGFSLVGSSLPAALPAQILQQALPEDVLQPDLKRALLGLVAPLALMAAGYAWLWYMHSITPLWQQLLCWLAVGTGYMGLFQLGTECARGTFLPDAPRAQALLGSLLMAPSLFSLTAWRVQAFNHFNTVNQLDMDSAWRTPTLEEVAAAGPVRRTWLRLITSTPLKLLTSIGSWVDTLQSWDLFSYYYELRQSILRGWLAPAAFVGLVLPCITACAGGLQGLLNYWLAPWLVFHMWLTTLSMLQHTAPHIAWFWGEQHDLTRAIVSGTVTITFPGWLEALLNYPNYHLPQHVLFTGVPFYHAKAATQALRQRLWPYMQEAPLTFKLLWNHLMRWQVYDEARQTYITFDDALARLEPSQTAGQSAAGGSEGAAGNGTGGSPVAA